MFLRFSSDIYHQEIWSLLNNDFKIGIKCRDSDKCIQQELCHNVRSVVGITVRKSQFTGPEFNFDYSQ